MIQSLSTDLTTAGLATGRVSVARCLGCGAHTACLFYNLNLAPFDSPQSAVVNARLLRRGQYLYVSGHTLRYLFAIRSGTIKTTIHWDERREQIIDVHGSGDALGLDGLETGHYTLDGVVLADALVCFIRYDRFTEMCRDVPALQRGMIEIMGRQLVRNVTTKLLMHMQPVEARIVSFLIEVAKRVAKQGFPSNEFFIGMTRTEIGNYLGTTLETVSRVLSALSREGILVVCGKRIRILDFDKLQARLASTGAMLTKTVSE
jgi:CRP/FNR family transcriptional regulator, anaerobic regulatory protein